MEPPVKPNESDCCGSGCNPCILDVYEEQLHKFKLGQLKTETATTAIRNCLSGTIYATFKLIDRRQHQKDALLLTFEYGPGSIMEDLNLLYQPSQYFLLKAGGPKDEFTRAYTPIPFGKEGRLQFTVLVKLYPDGRMSKYIKTLQIGNETLWRGPYGAKMTSSVPKTCKHILLIAQGAGIAPIYSILHYHLHNNDCNIFFKLLYCCKSNDIIYLHDNLYECKSYWNFEYEIFLSEVINDLQVKYNETVHCRKLNKDDVQSYLLGKSDVVLVILAGSPDFMGSIKGYAVESAGAEVKEENIILL